MEQELNQLVQAILIASDPTPGPLHNQALEYLTTVQQNSSESWRLALALFVDPGLDGGRKYPAPARFFALRVLEDFLDNRYVTNPSPFSTVLNPLYAQTDLSLLTMSPFKS